MLLRLPLPYWFVILAACPEPAEGDLLLSSQLTLSHRSSPPMSRSFIARRGREPPHFTLVALRWVANSTTNFKLVPPSCEAGIPNWKIEFSFYHRKDSTSHTPTEVIGIEKDTQTFDSDMDVMKHRARGYRIASNQKPVRYRSIVVSK
jgi:hypothetical protein